MSTDANLKTDSKVEVTISKSKLDPSKLDVFPAFHKVADRKVLVVGGSDEAAAKIRLLSETNARIVVVAKEFSQEVSDAAEANGNVLLLNREFQLQDLEDSVMVFAATGNLKRDIAIGELAREAGIPFNAVDRPEICDFFTPALVNRAPVAIGISSTGIGPVLSRRIRAKIEALLPMNTGNLAMLAHEFRETVNKFLGNGRDRLRFWSRFFEGSVSALVHAGQTSKARAEAQRLLNGKIQQSGFVWLVGAGPGAEDLLTLRAQRILQDADTILYDQLVPESVVAMGRRDALRTKVGKRKGKHSLSQFEISQVMIEEAKKGRKVVRLKSGDPLVFGRAGEEMEALRNAGIDFEVVPGVSTAFAAAASLEIPLTLRGVSSNIVFATGHDMDGKTLPDWAELTLRGSTVAVYMGKTVAGRVASRLIEAGIDGLTPVVAIENVSLPNETTYAGNLEDLSGFASNDEISGPVLIVIGDVVASASLDQSKPLVSECGWSDTAARANTSRIAA